MIVDACLFLNETDMFELRVRELADVVDLFVVIESGETFSSLPKPRNFPTDPAYLREYADRIHYGWLPELDGDDPWARERYQRNALATALRELDLPPSAVVLVSDCDEIPSPELVAHYAPSAAQGHEYVFEQALYFYNVHWRHVRPWYGTRMLRYDRLGEPQRLRSTLGPRHNEIVIPDGGWSFSYFGGVEAVQYKVSAYSHQEVNRPEYVNDAHVAAAIREGKSLVRGDGNEFLWVEPGEDLPGVMLAEPERWPASWFGDGA